MRVKTQTQVCHKNPHNCGRLLSDGHYFVDDFVLIQVNVFQSSWDCTNHQGTIRE